MNIKQSSGFVSDLMRSLNEGSLMPAAFQRPYVWSKSDVLALCDSIISGFPIGAFLIWNPGQKADLDTIARGRLGPIVMGDRSEARRPLGLLLDGQNRLATIAWMNCLNRDGLIELDGLSDIERSTWLAGETLVVDNITKSICFVPDAEANLGLRLPASSISGAAPMRLLRDRWNNEWKEFSEEEIGEFIAFFDTCQRMFSSARLSVTVIEDATPEEARHAFIRICRVGVPMSQNDFDQAIKWQS